MPAWDNVQLPSAPSTKDYAAPLMDFSAISKLPGDYFQGTQMGRTRALQTAFQGGLPKNPDGSIDVNAMTDKLAKLGGADAAMPLLQLQIQQQLGQSNANLIGGADNFVTGGGNATPSAQPPQPNANIPPHGIPSSAPDNGGASYKQTGEGTNPDTLANVVQAQIPDPNIAGRVISAAAAKLGVDPGAKIDPNNPTLQAYIKSAQGNVIPNGGTAGNAPTLQPTADGSGFQPVAQPQAQPPQRPAQAPGTTPPATSPGYQPPAGPTAAPGMDIGTVQRLETAGNAALARASAIAKFDPQGASALEAFAKNAFARAQSIRDTINKNSELTPEQKNAAASGAPNPAAYAAKTEVQKLDIAQGQKTYAGITAQSSQYERDLKPYLEVSRSILSDPQMYSGIGGKLSFDVNRVKAAFGDQKAAMLQAALQKVTASNVLGQINQQRDQLQEAGGTSSRIFSQQVALVEKAAPSLENTLGGNRFLVEVSTRMGELSSEIARQARDYKQAYGYLDAGFDRQVADYMKAHPVFTKQEMSHPEILGAPTVPPTMAGDKGAILNWGKQLGLKSGDAIRFPDGTVKAMP